MYDIFVVVVFVHDGRRMPLYADHHRPTSETPLNAFLWANIECWLCSFVIFQGIEPSIAKKPFFVIFQGGGGSGSRPLSLSVDPCMFVGYGQLNRHV